MRAALRVALVITWAFYILIAAIVGIPAVLLKHGAEFWDSLMSGALDWSIGKMID